MRWRGGVVLVAAVGADGAVVDARICWHQLCRKQGEKEVKMEEKTYKGSVQ